MELKNVVGSSLVREFILAEYNFFRKMLIDEPRFVAVP